MSPGRTEHIAQLIERGLQRKTPRGPLLPSIRTLAGQFSVSPVTILKAVGVLCRKGILEKCAVTNRYRVRGSKPDYRIESVRSPGNRRELVAETILRELLAGGFTANASLPSRKEYRQRFGCHPSTLNQALRDLERRGYIQRHGTRYLAVLPPAPPGRSQIFFMAHPDIFGNYQSHVLALVTAIERDIEQLGWGQLQFRLAPRPAPQLLPEPHQTSGFIYMPTFMTDDTWASYFSRNPEIPLVVIDPSGKFDTTRMQLPQALLISSDHQLAGRTIGLHLAALGHRRIAFISFLSPDQAQPWLVRRLEGLAEIFPLSGRGERSMIFVNTGQHVKTLDTPAQEWAARLRQTYSEAQERRLLPDEILQERYRTVLKTPSYYQQVRHTVPHLEALYQAGETTAWVCLNDHLAVVAFDFLRSHNTARPQRVSIVGFDNSLLAIRCGITSYDFSLDKMGHAATAALIRPEPVQPGELHQVVVQGQLIVRRSSGPVSGRRV